jgi:hypothetical protein
MQGSHVRYIWLSFLKGPFALSSGTFQIFKAIEQRYVVLPLMLKHSVSPRSSEVTPGFLDLRYLVPEKPSRHGDQRCETKHSDKSQNHGPRLRLALDREGDRPEFTLNANHGFGLTEESHKNPRSSQREKKRKDPYDGRHKKKAIRLHASPSPPKCLDNSSHP